MIGKVQERQLAALEDTPIYLLGLLDLERPMNLGPELWQPAQLLAHKVDVIVGRLHLTQVEDSPALAGFAPLPTLCYGLVTFDGMRKSALMGGQDHGSTRLHPGVNAFEHRLFGRRSPKEHKDLIAVQGAVPNHLLAGEIEVDNRPHGLDARKI